MPAARIINTAPAPGTLPASLEPTLGITIYKPLRDGRWLEATERGLARGPRLRKLGISPPSSALIPDKSLRSTNSGTQI